MKCGIFREFHVWMHLFFYLITACILTLPKICEMVPLKGLYYWTFIPDP